VKSCFGELYDYDKAQLLTKKVKDNLVSLYEFYLKADEDVDNNMHKQDINDVIDDIEVNVNTLARFKRRLHEEDSVENRNEVERYLVDG
jgi:putative ubiquitin-RnfH superfamily antitoxin RatB of RatAB toxin-antitoxin module